MALHYSLYGISDDEDDPRPAISYEDDEPQAIEEIVEGEIEPFNDAETAGSGDDLEGLFGDPGAPATDAEKKEAKEKKVRKQSNIPKLNGERLMGPGGLIVIDELFADFKMQGRGRELDDLNQILQRFQTWTHRMYPRFAFPDCIEQIERLGRKKDIKGFMLRNRNQALLPVVIPVCQVDDDEDEAAVDNPGPMRMQMDDDDPAPMRSDNVVPPPALTADILEQMRLNREVALARRKEKMKEREASEMATSHVSVSALAPASPIDSRNFNTEDPASDDVAIAPVSPFSPRNAISKDSGSESEAVAPPSSSSPRNAISEDSGSESEAVALPSPSSPRNAISEDSIELETPMEVDQPLDEAVSAFSPVASQAVDESDQSLSR